MPIFTTRCACLLLIASLLAPSITSGDLIINIQPGANLAANAAALAAFNRAGNQWEALFSDNVTVNINAEIANLGSPTIIGQASSVVLAASYATIRNAMVADALNEPSDSIVAFLPTTASFILPAGFSLDGNVSASKANLKALGFTGLDGLFGSSDGQITFNSNFSFDFDNSNGVTGGQMDFETVAAHEIGHTLGFFSEVDTIDFRQSNNQTASDIEPTTLDLFRFGPLSNPATTADFATSPRDLRPGVAAFFDDLSMEYLFSTGRTQGDGRQASHWKDNDLTSTLIGMMDPTLAFGQTLSITSADTQALDLIGWDQIEAVPEPGLAGVSILALVVFTVSRYRRILLRNSYPTFVRMQRIVAIKLRRARWRV
jgi:hypothetical protein